MQHRSNEIREPPYSICPSCSRCPCCCSSSFAVLSFFCSSLPIVVPIDLILSFSSCSRTPPSRHLFCSLVLFVCSSSCASSSVAPPTQFPVYLLRTTTTMASSNQLSLLADVVASAKDRSRHHVRQQQPLPSQHHGLLHEQNHRRQQQQPQSHPHHKHFVPFGVPGPSTMFRGNVITPPTTSPAPPTTAAAAATRTTNSHYSHHQHSSAMPTFAGPMGPTAVGTGNGVATVGRSGLSRALTNEEKKMKRMIANRQSARQSRERRKKHLRGLQTRLGDLNTHNQQLQGMNGALRRELHQLKSLYELRFGRPVPPERLQPRTDESKSEKDENPGSTGTTKQKKNLVGCRDLVKAHFAKQKALPPLPTLAPPSPPSLQPRSRFLSQPPHSLYHPPQLQPQPQHHPYQHQPQHQHDICTTEPLLSGKANSFDGPSPRQMHAPHQEQQSLLSAMFHPTPPSGRMAPPSHWSRLSLSPTSTATLEVAVGATSAAPAGTPGMAGVPQNVIQL